MEVEVKILSKTSILSNSDVMRISAYSDIPLPPLPHYEAIDCFLCKSALSFFTGRITCPSCGLVYCKDCYSNGYLNLCPICSSFEQPKEHISQFPALHQYALRHKVDCNNLYGVRYSTRIISNLLKSKDHTFHFLAAYLLHKYKKVLLNLPFDKRLINCLSEHSFDCKCDSSSLTLDLFCDLFQKLYHLMQNVSISLTRMDPLLSSPDTIVQRAATRLFLILCSQNKIRADIPEVLGAINTSDQMTILYLLSSIMISLPQPTLQTIHMKNPDVPTLLNNCILIANICNMLLEKKQIPTIQYNCAAILARISQFKDGIEALTNVLKTNRNLWKSLTKLMKTHLPTAEAGNKEDCIIAVLVAEIFYQLVLFCNDDSAKRKKIIDLIKDIFITVLETNIVYEPESYFCELQIIFFDTFLLIENDKECDFVTGNETLCENLKRLREENEDRAAKDPTEVEIDQKLSKQEEIIEKLREEKERISAQVENAETEGNEMKEVTDKRVAKITQNIKRLNEKSQMKEQRINQLISKEHKIKAQKESTESDIAKVEEEIANSEKEIKDMQSQIEVYLKDIDTKQTEIDSNRNKLNSLSTELSNLKEANKANESNTDSLSKEVYKLNDQCEDLKDTLAELQQQNQRLSEKLKSILSKQENEKSSLEEKNQKVELQMEINKSLQQKIAEAQNTKQSLTEECSALIKELEVIEIKIEEMNQKQLQLKMKEKSALSMLQTANQTLEAKKRINKQSFDIREKELLTTGSVVSESLEKSKESKEKKVKSLLNLWKSAEGSLAKLGFSFNAEPYMIE